MRARTDGPRTFDAVVVGQRETDAWVAYYRHEWVAFLRASVGMVAAGFGMNRLDTVRGAVLVLRANQAWAPFPHNDPQRARELMRTFYALVARASHLAIDPTRAAALEVDWWRVHREHQHDGAVTTEDLVAALVALYAYVYAADPALVRPAAAWRVEAMDLSDEWVRRGCSMTDPLLSAERRALVASYAGLLDAVGRSRV
ncbi:hypothetical protein GCM10009868_23900 [Terrabacter aerolatus]|uniref:Uncharacterized protein n=1 Tax=Terrabacter aerolatus TaxID=422442 RepID=A0A512D5G7_9MICO|nr:hypothetical protein [Terrabacter aerolatus]GEO31706.1 hypothetical protein TAE01_35160 [Terrabacter aerolatus]